MTDRELLQQALNALEAAYHPDTKAGGVMEAISARLAQHEQEPVAVWELQEGGWDTIADAEWMETLPIGTKLYTAPPQREWVGLTKEEIKSIVQDHTDLWGDVPNTDGYGIAESVEAMLKGKNL